MERICFLFREVYNKDFMTSFHISILGTRAHSMSLTILELLVIIAYTIHGRYLKILVHVLLTECLLFLWILLP